MERIKRAVAEARQQRQRHQEVSVVQTLRGTREDEVAPSSNTLPLKPRRNAKVWLGIAVAAIIIGTAMWIATSMVSERRLNIGAVDSDAGMSGGTTTARADTSSVSALSAKLALLQARVDLLDDSIRGVNDRLDKLTDLRVQINTISNSVDSTVTSKKKMTTKAFSAHEAPVTTSEQEDKPAPVPDATSDPKATEVLSAAQKSAATVEGGDASMGGSSAAPDEGPAINAWSAEKKSSVSVALFRSPEALKSLRHAYRKSLTKPSDKQGSDLSGTPEEAPTETGSAKKTSVVARADGLWVINLASYSDKRDADRFAKRTQSKDIHTEQHQVTVKGKPYWRVQVPGFSSAEDAKIYAASIEAQLGLKETWVMRR
jgi:hypothetical protein